MKPRPEYRDRDPVEVAVLDALVDRREEGMTIFELRTHAEVSIDDLEDALAALKEDDLIDVDETGDRMVIKPDERVVPDEPVDDRARSFIEELRERLPF